MVTIEEDVVEVNEAMRGLLKPGKRAAYVFAGKSLVTLRNPKTGARFTFRVTKAKETPTFKAKCFYVSVLNGPDNTRNYAYIGSVFEDKILRTTKASKVKLDAPSAKAFAWFLRHPEETIFEAWHEGSCGRCGRPLTVPESIETGLGPICEVKTK